MGIISVARWAQDGHVMVDNVFVVMVGPNLFCQRSSLAGLALLTQRRKACSCRPSNRRWIVRGVLFRGDVALLWTGPLSRAALTPTASRLRMAYRPVERAPPQARFR